MVVNWSEFIKMPGMDLNWFVMHLIWLGSIQNDSKWFKIIINLDKCQDIHIDYEFPYEMIANTINPVFMPFPVWFWHGQKGIRPIPNI